LVSGTAIKAIALGALFMAASVAAQSTSPFGEPIREFGGATLLTRDWMSFRDYPSAAISGGAEGRVVVSFDITVKGRAESCQVQTSSGHGSLDSVPCSLLERKARFRPPTDLNGVPSSVKAIMSVDFWMPR